LNFILINLNKNVEKFNSKKILKRYQIFGEK
jgi:hypothetical protein